MKVSIRSRGLALAVASAALLAVTFAAPASALTSSVTCAKFSSTLTGGKVASTYSSCTPTALKAGGKGVIPKTPPKGTPKGQLALVITWTGGKGTTNLTIKFTTLTAKGKCATLPGSARFSVTGSVVSATGAAKLITKAGEPVVASACVYSLGAKSGQAVIEPGTKFKL